MHIIVLKKVGRNIRRLREKAGHSQEGFAQYADIERARYGKIERGQANMSVRTIVRICAHLNVHPSDIWRGVTMDDMTASDPEI